MPTAYIEKLAKQGKGSVAELEKKWDEAKSAAAKEGKSDNYGYITSIFQSKVGASVKAFTIQAAARMQVIADSFEGWLNTLGYKYERTEGKQEAILMAPYDDVHKKLTDNDWERIRSPNGLQKGDHIIRVMPSDENTKIISVK